MSTLTRLTPPPDREMLRLLLKFANLTGSEAACFKRMHDALASGQLVELAQGDRLWVRSAFDKYGVWDLQYAARQRAGESAKDRPRRPSRN